VEHPAVAAGNVAPAIELLGHHSMGSAGVMARLVIMGSDHGVQLIMMRIKTDRNINN
jgi:hypothetical protein